MSSGDPKVLPKDGPTSDESKSQKSNSKQNPKSGVTTSTKNSANLRSTTNAAPAYVSPYRQTQRSVSSPSSVTRANAANPGVHSANFKDIVSRFNQKQDEKIPLPTNKTAASRMPPTTTAGRSRKAPPPWRPGGTAPLKETGTKSRQIRSGSALGSNDAKTTSRTSSRASSTSNTSEVRNQRRPSEGVESVEEDPEHSEEKIARGLPERMPGADGVDSKHRRSKSFVDQKPPLLNAYPDPTSLRHRRSKSNVESSSLLLMKSGIAEALIIDTPRTQVPEVLVEAALDSPTELYSPSSRIPVSSKKPTSTVTVNDNGRNTSRKSAASTAGPRLRVHSHNGTKSPNLSPAKVSPHSSRHVPQPSKSPTLKAYITPTPPKKSPPLRSRPRIPNAPAIGNSRQPFSHSSRNNGPMQTRGDNTLQTRPSRSKKKIPELGSIDFAARRATIQAAFNKSLNESVAREGQGRLITKQASMRSMSGEIEEADEDLAEDGFENLVIKTPVEETILEGLESDDPLPQTELTEQNLVEPEGEEKQEAEEEEAEEEKEAEGEEDEADMGRGQKEEQAVNGVVVLAETRVTEKPQNEEKTGKEEWVGRKVSEELPTIAPELEYEAKLSTSVESMRNGYHENNFGGIEEHLEQLPAYEAGDNGPGVYLNEKPECVPDQTGELETKQQRQELEDVPKRAEMTERPGSQRLSLTAPQSIRWQIDDLPSSPQKDPGEDSPLSPFTRSLLFPDEPLAKRSVSVIITPEHSIEPRAAPPRLTDISKFLRPDSAASDWSMDYEGGSERGNDPRGHRQVDGRLRSDNDARQQGNQLEQTGFHTHDNTGLSPMSAISRATDESYTPTDDGATIISVLDHYDEPREDFLTPYIDSPGSTYATTIAESDRGRYHDGDDDDGSYEGDEEEHSSCSSSSTMQSARPSIAGSEEWLTEPPSASSRLSMRLPDSPSTPRQVVDDDSPLPPTPPPKDVQFLPPVPRKNSVPFLELANSRSSPRNPQHTSLTLPEIPTDTEPLGLAIHIAAPTSLISPFDQTPAFSTIHVDSQQSSEHPASITTTFSPPSSYYSEQDGSRRNSGFTISMTSTQVVEITPPSSIVPSLRGSTSTSDPAQEQKNEQKMLTKRKNIMKELVDTEKSYFQDMTVTEEIYKGTANACSALSSDDVKIMFGNTDAIVQFSKVFLESLKSAVASVYVPKKSRSTTNSSRVSLVNSVSGDENFRGSLVNEGHLLSDEERDRGTYVGEAFGEYLGRMEKIYGDYCKNHEAAVARLQRLESTNGVAIWLRECKSVAEDLTNAWSLESLLIKPVQRVLKYPLILSSLLQVTPSDHPDYTALTFAEKEVRLAADRINELKKRKDIVEKIVRKRNDSDIRHGIAKLITRRAEMLRQTMGASEAVVDRLYDKLVENFNMHYVQIQVVFRDIDHYVVKSHEFWDQYLEIPSSIKDFVDLSQTHYPEIESKWRKFDSAVKDMVKLALSEHTHRVKKHCVEPLESLLKMYDNPQRIMLKRNKKAVDFARFNAIKDKGNLPDKKTTELAEAYVALNEALIEELPTLFGLTKKLVMVILENFIDLQYQWNQTVSGTLLGALPDLTMPADASDITTTFSADFSYNENSLKELGICNVTTLKAISSPFGSLLSPSSTVSLEENENGVQMRPYTADTPRERSLSLTNRSQSSQESDRRHSSEMTVAAAMSAMATALPAASHMVSNTARARSSSVAYATRPGAAPLSPKVLRSLSANSPTRTSQRAPTSHPRPSSASTFAAVPESESADITSRVSTPSPGIYSGAFSSAMPMSDNEQSPGPSRSSSRQSRRRTMTLANDNAPLFVAVSLYEFNIDKQRREAGFPYLTYVQGEVFDVIGVKGEIWLAKNQDDESGEIGWIWCKHFHRISPD